MCRERSLDELGVHAPQPVPVLDDHRGHRRVREQATELGARPVQPRADFCFSPDDRLASLGCPLGKPSHLTVEVASLVVGGHPDVETEGFGRHRLGRRVG